MLECNFKYLVYSLNTTGPFATFLPSACLYIPALDFKIKTFIIKTNSGIGSFNPTLPKEGFLKRKITLIVYSCKSLSTNSLVTQEIQLLCCLGFYDWLMISIPVAGYTVCKLVFFRGGGVVLF